MGREKEEHSFAMLLLKFIGRLWGKVRERSGLRLPKCRKRLRKTEKELKLLGCVFFLFFYVPKQREERAKTESGFLWLLAENVKKIKIKINK